MSLYAGSDIRFPYFRTRIADGVTLIDRAARLKEQIGISSQYLSKELAKPINCIDRELREITGIGPQFFVHIAAADGRAKSSMFKDLFRSQGGQMMQVGPVEIERMAFMRTPAMGMPSEISLIVVPYNNGARITLRGDATVFEEEELAAFAEPLLENMSNV